MLHVQQSLNKIPPTFGGPSKRLAEDSKVGPITVGAICDFQQRHFGFHDGRVDVMGKTHAKLSSLLPNKLQRMKVAKTYLAQSMDCMAAAQAGLLAAGAELLTGGGFLGTRNLDLADKHFDIRRSPDPARALTEIGSIFAKMLTLFARPAGLLGWSAFEAEPFTDPHVYAFTWWGGYTLAGKYIGWQRLDTVYLSGYYDKAGTDDRIQTVVHELSHFVGPASGHLIYDYAYGWQSDRNMMDMTPYQKQHNAESFGNYAFEAKFGRRIHS